MPARGVLTGNLDTLTDAERRVAEDLLASGKNLELIPRASVRTPDFKIDGVLHGLKTISGVAKIDSNSLSGAISSRVMQGRGQASHILNDARNQVGMTKEIAERGIDRAFGADRATGDKIDSIRIIGEGFDITVRKMK